MDGWAIVMWSVGGALAVSALLRLMIARRNEVVDEWQAQVAAERRKHKKPEKEPA